MSTPSTTLIAAIAAESIRCSRERVQHVQTLLREAQARGEPLPDPFDIPPEPSKETEARRIYDLIINWKEPAQ